MEVGGCLLQGSIDVVERHPSGVVRVVDHKTGKIPDPRPEMVGQGEVLQPALYAMAADDGRPHVGDFLGRMTWLPALLQRLDGH